MRGEVEYAPIYNPDDDGVEVVMDHTWRVRCPSHRTIWDTRWERQARTLAADCCSFCPDCQDELRRELSGIQPLTEWSRTDQDYEAMEREDYERMEG